MLMRIYRSMGQDLPFENCFYVECSRAFTHHEIEVLEWLLAEPLSTLGRVSRFEGEKVVEVGPRLSFETPFSSNVVSICRELRLPVVRIECSTRWQMIETPHEEVEFDRMTDMVYEYPITSFTTSVVPRMIAYVSVLERREEALREANSQLELGLNEGRIADLVKLFVRLGRDPTDVELLQDSNANSEHSRHWFFRGVQIIDGVTQPSTLMDIVKAPWKAHPNNNLVAFHDNAGVIWGSEVDVLMPKSPGEPSAFTVRRLLQHLTATAETHNHPTMIAPFPGATTGAGGRIRDSRAVGRGGLVHAGFAGYCYGDVNRREGRRHASPLDVILKGHAGIADYGNKIGEPLIGGFCRSFSQMIGGHLREFVKPILYTAGLGRVLDIHTKKHAPEVGMCVVRFGGPAYRIGVGGGSASSMAAGENSHEADLKSVQRGDAEMENRANRAIQACAELLDHNPIESIHDQGAGGPSNVLTELVEPLGGRINIREIMLGDRTMSVLEIWVAEFQEGYGALVRPENIEVFKKICERERVNCEVLGDITGDGNITVYDGDTGEIHVDLPLADILTEIKPKTFVSEHLSVELPALVLPPDLTVEEALKKVFALSSVGSKGHLVRIVDRSVTGLVARQQCVGPMQIPVADCGVTADGYFGFTGAAAALGENPNRMLINPEAGARMAVAEMLTNLAGVRVSSLRDIACRANWMWPAKRPGQGALLYDAAVAMQDIMLALGITVNGGKDSLSMEALVEVLGEEKRVMSPGELVIFGYAPVPDITKVVTPDFKGVGVIGFVDLGLGKNRLGASALAQSFGQLGNECPTIEDPKLLGRAFEAIQELIEKNLITAYHDRSDGGLITTIAEMCIAGNCGAKIRARNSHPIPELFSEEAGMVIEYSVQNASEVRRVMRAYALPFQKIGNNWSDSSRFIITKGSQKVLDQPLSRLRMWWEATSSELEFEMETANPYTIRAEIESFKVEKGPSYHISFTPKAPAIVPHDSKPLVAIVREEGTNGDREMAAAFVTAGCTSVDVAMSDLRSGKVKSLDRFQGVVFPGGFSFADALGSGRGWAAPIVLDPTVRAKFERFYERSDTFSLGVCNGCQFMSTVGWMLYKNLPDANQPRLLHNTSGRFESRWSVGKVLKSPAVLMNGMEGSMLGIHSAHGEGRFHFPDEAVLAKIRKENLIPLAYVDPEGECTEVYPHNPNGSPSGIAALCSPDGRHLAMMPHPERCFLTWQWPWMPCEWHVTLKASPWLQMFVNARDWCLAHR
ncbi:MAG: phosphoribosylformylglycinamidine synthase [bacterium]|nr:phosphoribosylformylglycinamidine synthase [bacterium]